MIYSKTFRRASRAEDQPLAPYSVSRFNVALKASAAALSALDPTAPMDWRTPSSAEGYWADSTGRRNTSVVEEDVVAQGRARAAILAGRPLLRSPGRPPVNRREERERFWRLIAEGLSSEGRDWENLTLRTAAWGALSLMSAAGGAGSAHKASTEGSIALTSATGSIGHVLTKAPRA